MLGRKVGEKMVIGRRSYVITIVNLGHNGEVVIKIECSDPAFEKIITLDPP